MQDPDPNRSFLSRAAAQPLTLAETMSIRATTPYYSSAHTAARTAGPAAGKAAAAKESAKGMLKSPWMVAVLPFVNGGLSGMVVSRGFGRRVDGSKSSPRDGN
jgi:hypothetical protein